MPASPSLELALAEPAAVPPDEPPAKHATRPQEPEEAAPVHRVMPRFVPLLPRTIASLARHPPARLAPLAARVTPILARHVHAKARADAAKPDLARAAAAPKRPSRHAIRQVAHRAQRATIAPSTPGSPYPTYGVTSGVQYR
jgi:hypothetical protein